MIIDLDIIVEIDEIVYKNMEFKNYFYFWKFEIHDLKAKIKERLDYISRK